MFLSVEKKIIKLLETVSEMVQIFNKVKQPESSNDCKMALESIQKTLLKEDVLPQQSIDLIALLIQSFVLLSEMNETNSSNKQILQNLKLLRKSIKKEIKVKLNVAFFPYKASMWNSLETVYEAASQDINCVAKVIPVPFYEIGGTQPLLCYEGDQFPEAVPITPYNQYDLETEQPDIIFVHNIYDQYNTITQLEPTYFASNLKRYTDMLVYIPYCVSSYNKYEQNDFCASYPSPAVQFVDKIVVANKLIKEGGMKKGIPEDRFLVLGSPKIDGLVRALKDENLEGPAEWKDKLEGKTVYLLNTGCLYFADSKFIYSRISTITRILDMARYDEKNVVIWRPHPLTMASLKKYNTPEAVAWYITTMKELQDESFKWMNKNIIIDNTPDYKYAMKRADVLISGDSSLLLEYLVTEKKIIYFNEKLTDALFLDPKTFYYYVDNNIPNNSLNENIYVLPSKFNEGYDPKKQYRKGLAKKIYRNIDGTCGKTVYEVVKSFCVEE